MEALTRQRRSSPGVQDSSRSRSLMSPARPSSTSGTWAESATRSTSNPTRPSLSAGRRWRWPADAAPASPGRRPRPRQSSCGGERATPTRFTIKLPPTGSASSSSRSMARSARPSLWQTLTGTASRSTSETSRSIGHPGRAEEPRTGRITGFRRRPGRSRSPSGPLTREIDDGAHRRNRARVPTFETSNATADAKERLRRARPPGSAGRGWLWPFVAVCAGFLADRRGPHLRRPLTALRGRLVYEFVVDDRSQGA
jgi:hypothetical protein